MKRAETEQNSQAQAGSDLKAKYDYREYKKEWDRKRREKKSEQKSGRSSRNLDFFTEIIRNIGLNNNKLAELSGISQQLISYWIGSDDIKMSRLMDLFDRIGITIECSYSPLQERRTIEDSSGDRKFTLEIGNLPSFSRAPEKNDVIKEALSGNGRLRFLAEMIDGRYRDLMEFCRQTGLQYFTCYQWFAKDDIKISHIYDIAGRTGNTVSWKVTEKKKEQQGTEQNQKAASS